jgi:histidinol dehydrogenase
VIRTIAYGGTAWRRWLASLPRSSSPRAEVLRTAAGIVRAVRRGGDDALVRLTGRLDGERLAPRQLRVPKAEIESLARRADRRVVAALRAMARRIEAFHRRQLAPGFRLALADGSLLEEVVQPLASAGLYVPGGAGAYPSSVLMNAIPARVAGVPRLVVVTPPRTLERSPAVAAAILLAGVEERVFRVGGAQAVAALAYGTPTIPAVDKIVGPGNAYVAAAKRLVRGQVEVDAEAGPSEVAVLADASADPGWVAVDLLAQAEHGSGDETVVLVTTSRELAAEATRLVAEGLRCVANPGMVRRALARNAAVVRVRDLAEGVRAVNALAPEHVEVLTRGARELARGIVAGAVFVGPWSPVAVGDYGVGPNHVLPTGGGARYASALSVRDFQRRQSVVTMTRGGLARVAEGVVRVAAAEGFRGHAQSVLTRFEGE